MATRTAPRNPTMASAPAALRIARACAGECAWLLLSLLAATLFLVAFVLLAEPVQARAIGDELASPVNVTRLVVLTAAVWLWAYIARAVRSVGPKPVRGEDAALSWRDAERRVDPRRGDSLRRQLR